MFGPHYLDLLTSCSLPISKDHYFHIETAHSFFERSWTHSKVLVSIKQLRIDKGSPGVAAH